MAPNDGTEIPGTNVEIVSNWRAVLKRAWSVRLMAIAALLCGAEAILPFFDVHPAIVFCVVVAAFIARFVPQGLSRMWRLQPQCCNKA